MSNAHGQGTSSRFTIACIVSVLIAFGAVIASASQTDELLRAAAIASEVETIANEVSLWPGFTPLKIPLAVFTGEATYLYRHPKSVEGFRTVEGSTPTADHFPGRYPAMTANSSAEIGGVMTATVLADKADSSTARQLAAVALHEAFHVDQRARHPNWSANEMDLMLYPFGDSMQLTWRRMETELLRRSLSSATPERAACWAREGLEIRETRFASLAPNFVSYERASEWNEGLASYVQIRAAGETSVDIPSTGFPATDLRRRFYAIGPALALLLDQHRPGWKKDLEEDDQQPLDKLLSTALGSPTDDNCLLTPEEAADLEDRAIADAETLSQDRKDQRNTFDATPGFRVVLQAAPGQPLWPQGFDPLNIQLVEGGLLHQRMLQLGNDAGQLTAIDEGGADISCLTVGAGDHPLFQGIQRVEIAGLSTPDVQVDGAEVRLSTPGLTLEFFPVTLETKGNTLLITLDNPLP